MKQHLPTKEQIRSNRMLRLMGSVLFEPNLWHFNRHSVSFAVAIGLFCAFLPIPFQMLPCALGCIWLRANLPLAIAMVWISNPITMPPMFYGTYKLGTWILGEPNRVMEINLSWEWLSAELGLIWQPLLLGSLIAGTVVSCSGFLLTRLYWRWVIYRKWQQRKTRQSSAG
ncbi:MAG: DUF2062 domain-containing protein [Pseudomonadota bacterium]